MFFNTPEEGLTTSRYSSYPDIGIDDALVKFLETAGEEDTVYLAFYSTTTRKITDAIKAADVRTSSGVYHIMDRENGDGYSFLVDRSTNNTVAESNSFMHHKFVVIIDTTNAKGRIWTGSYNPSIFGTESSIQNSLWIESFELAQAYAEEFLTMWSGNFGDDKNHDYASAEVDIKGTRVEVYFAPHEYDSDRARKVESLMGEAEKSILFSMFTFTEQRIINALISADDRGRSIKGLVEDRQTYSRETAEYLRDEGLAVYTFGYGLDLHHKYALIDPGTPDAKTITGSSNWTPAGLGGHASDNNDENFLVIHCPDITDRYYKEFMKNYSLVVSGEEEARGIPAVSNTRAWPSPVRAHEDADRVNIAYELSGAAVEATVHIYNISGRRIESISSDDILPGAENEVEWVFDSSSPGPGLYIAAVEVETGDGVFYDTTKFAVIR